MIRFSRSEGWVDRLRADLVAGALLEELPLVEWLVGRCAETATGEGHRFQEVLAEVRGQPPPPPPGRNEMLRRFSTTARAQLLSHLGALDGAHHRQLVDELEAFLEPLEGSGDWGTVPRRLPSSTQLKLREVVVAGVRLLLTQEAWFVWVIDVGEPDPAARRDADLEARLAANPDSLENHLVYGDWLQQQGNPLGELITLQCELERSSGRRRVELEAASRRFLERHGPTLLGPWHELGQVVWRRGFVRELHFVDDTEEGTLKELVPAFAQRPAGRMLETLSLRNRAPHNYVSVAALARYLPTTLLELSLLDELDVDAGTARMCLQLLEGLDRFPRLHTLALRGRVELDDGPPLRLPALRSFALEGALGDDNIAPLMAAQWPRLERLRIGGMAAQPRAPGNALVAQLVHARWVGQLRALDLRGCGLDDVGVAELVRRRGALARLEELDVRDNGVTERGRGLLEGFCPTVRAE